MTAEFSALATPKYYQSWTRVHDAAHGERATLSTMTGNNKNMPSLLSNESNRPKIPLILHRLQCYRAQALLDYQKQRAPTIELVTSHRIKHFNFSPSG